MVYQLPFADLNLRIPAGAENHQESLSVSLGIYILFLNLQMGISDAQTPMTIYGIAPHAHELGTEILFKIIRANGDEETLVHIPKWRFDWQNAYEFKTPVTVEREDRLRISCIYDNLTENEVTWGDETTDEMCLVFLLATFED